MDSPCIASCKLNADKICIGCYRHIEEIVDWNKRSDAEHAAIYQKLAERKLQLANMPADSTSATAACTARRWACTSARHNTPSPSAKAAAIHALVPGSHCHKKTGSPDSSRFGATRTKGRPHAAPNASAIHSASTGFQRWGRTSITAALISGSLCFAGRSWPLCVGLGLRVECGHSAFAKWGHPAI